VVLYSLWRHESTAVSEKIIDWMADNRWHTNDHVLV